MDAEEFLFRALDVPGVLTPNGRVLAAGARLREAAGLDNPSVWPPHEEAVIEMTTALLATVAAALRNGTLDPLLGEYGGGDPSRVVRRVAADATSIPARFEAHTEPLVDAAVHRLLKFETLGPLVGALAGKEPTGPTPLPAAAVAVPGRSGRPRGPAGRRPGPAAHDRHSVTTRHR